MLLLDVLTRSYCCRTKMHLLLAVPLYAFCWTVLLRVHSTAHTNSPCCCDPAARLCRCVALLQYCAVPVYCCWGRGKAFLVIQLCLFVVIHLWWQSSRGM
jgi:hypothetical protein